MKPLIRLFFRTLRLILAPFMLLGYWLTRPKGIVRPPAAQQAVDARTRSLALYHYPTCPFCLKTRRVMQRLSLDIELRDAKNDPQHREALLQGGGAVKVPCLKITDAQGNSRWMYESGDIIQYLNERFA